MRRTIRRVLSFCSLGLLTGLAGCAGDGAGTAADQLMTFAVDFLRQSLAAFLL